MCPMTNEILFTMEHNFLHTGSGRAIPTNVNYVHSKGKRLLQSVA